MVSLGAGAAFNIEMPVLNRLNALSVACIGVSNWHTSTYTLATAKKQKTKNKSEYLPIEIIQINFPITFDESSTSAAFSISDGDSESFAPGIMTI